MRAAAHTTRQTPPDRHARPGRFPLRRWAPAGLTALLLLSASTGCKSTKNNVPSGGAMAKAKTDPLLGGPRIPAQNVPTVPETGIGSRGRSDPLLGSPTGRPGERSGWIKGGTDPDRLKGTFLPDSSSTPAALAGALGDSVSDLGIRAEDRIPRPKSGPVTLTPAGAVLPPTTDAFGRELPPTTGVFSPQLEALGVRATDFTVSRSSNGEFVATARVSIKDSDAQKQYTGVGPSQEDAVRQLAELIRSDR